MSNQALREQMGLYDELRQIVTAMRNLAYAELQRVERALEAQRQAEACVLQALADVDRRHGSGRPTKQVLLIIGSERGFCGGFNEQLISHLANRVGSDGSIHKLTAGARLADQFAGDAADESALPGSSTTDECVSVVDGWVAKIEQVMGAELADRAALSVIYHGGGQIQETQLLPRPKLPMPSPGGTPAYTMSTHLLLPTLSRECVRISLLGICYTSLAQENRWRLMQMQRAQDHLDEAASRVRRRYFDARQTDITSELETLMSSLNVAPPSAIATNSR